MKGLKTKEAISLAGIAVTTPILALAILVSARRAAVADYDLLLVLLSLCGAVVSGLNGFGRRTTKTRSAEQQKPQSKRRSFFLRLCVTLKPSLAHQGNEGPDNPKPNLEGATK